MHKLWANKRTIITYGVFHMNNTGSEKKVKLLSNDFLSSLHQVSDPDVKDIPIALANIFDLLNNSSVDVGNFYVEKTLGLYTGEKLKRYTDGIVRLNEALKNAGATSPDRAINSSSDNWIFRLDSPYWQHAIHLRTQTRQYIVLLRFGSDPNECRSDTERIYQSCPDVNLAGLERLMDDLFAPQLHIRNCGPEYEAQEIANCNLGGCDFLRYGDSRDNGYVATLKDGKVDAAIHYYADICNSLYNLASHIECMEDYLQ